VVGPAVVAVYVGVAVELAVGVAVGRRMLSLDVDVERAGVEGVVRVAVSIIAGAGAVAVAVDEGGQRGPKQEAVVDAATGGTHRVGRGRTKTRRDRRITIGNEDTTKRWPRQVDQAVDSDQIKICARKY